MRKNFLLLIFASLVLSVGTILAKQQTEWTHYAYGTLDNYDEVEASAEVVSGFWNLKVLGDKVWFNGYYLEKNLDQREDEPIGSTDIFEWEMDGKPRMSWDENNLTIEGNMKITKTAAMHDGTYKQTTTIITQTLIFNFDEGEFLRDTYPPDPEDPDIYGEPPPWWQDWDLRGTLIDHNWSS
ncbi:hypothetical protein GF319_01210 [Candidatus Bathyarchaeota archaeon]|nr:hypothetical protein [Candidatus Bathyarchaeota archaeon]